MGTIVLLSACEHGALAPAGPDPLIERLVEMGFRRDQIVDAGEQFIVEGDIVIKKADLRAKTQTPTPGVALPPGAPRYQRHHTDLVSSGNTTGIRVDLSQVVSESSEWAEATRQGLTNWGIISGTTVSFVEGTSAHITVSFSDTITGGTVARSSFPANGLPGPTLQINRAYKDYYTHGQKTFIMTHEFGHNVGLHHTNTSNGTQIPGTPPDDPNSVMNSGDYYSSVPSWSAFSGYDETAVIWLYPDRASLSVTVQSGYPYLSWGALSGASYYTAVLVTVSTTEDYNGSSTETSESVLGTTTGTFWHDTAHPYTGISSCSSASGWTVYTQDYYYLVRTQFPNGVTESSYVPAEIGDC